MDFEESEVYKEFIKVFFTIFLIILSCMLYTGFINFKLFLFMIFISLLCIIGFYRCNTVLGDYFKRKYSKKNTIKIKVEDEKGTQDNFYENINCRPKIHSHYYQMLLSLKSRFDNQEKETYNLIEILFPNPQITNEKFTDDIVELHSLFYSKFDSLRLFYFNYPSEDDISKDMVIKGYEDLTKIYEMLLDLKKELSKLLIEESDVEDSLEDIQKVIKDIHNYKININLGDYEKD